MKAKLIGERPILPQETRIQIREIMDKLNEDALRDFIPHDVLVLVVDRAWCAMFPDKQSDVKRKKYIKLPF